MIEKYTIDKLNSIGSDTCHIFYADGSIFVNNIISAIKLYRENPSRNDFIVNMFYLNNENKMEHNIIHKERLSTLIDFLNEDHLDVIFNAKVPSDCNYY